MRGLIRASLLLAAVVVGCGGENAAAPPPAAATPAPANFSKLTILLKPSKIAEVNNAAQAALIGAGYALAADARAAHNAEADLNAIATEIPSVFQVQVNGVAKKDFKISVTLVLRSGGRVIDQFSTEFEAKGGQVTPAQFNGLVSSMATSERVKAFAAEQSAVVASREAAAKAKAEDEAAKKAAEDAARAEEDASFDRILAACREPKNAKSCDELKGWYQRSDPKRTGARPEKKSGKDMQRDAERRVEAGKVLDASKATIQDLADEEAWSQLNVGRCKLGDCVAVSAYLSRFPTGKHAEDAEKAIAEGERARAEVAERERKQEEAEERAQNARAQQAACKSKCSTDACVAYTSEDKKAACVAQCVQGCK